MIAINEYQNNNGKLEDHLDKGFEVLEDLPSFWDKSSPELQNKLLSFMFPEGFFYDGKKVGTIKIATIFKVFEGNSTQKSTLMHHCLQNWSQILKELYDISRIVGNSRQS